MGGEFANSERMVGGLCIYFWMLKYIVLLQASCDLLQRDAGLGENLRMVT